MVSIDNMNTQINLRLPEKMLATAKICAEEQGYTSLQEFIKEVLREKLFEKPAINSEEKMLLQKLVALIEEKKIYGTEQELFAKLRR